MVNSLRASRKTAVLISEELDEAIIIEDEYKGKYCVVFDPLDGSSNIDAGVKIEPTLTPASMLLLPSSGSNTTQYFRLYSSSMIIASSSFSEMSTAVLRDARRELTMISFERTSSFFCSSPCTFVSPARPILIEI